MKAAKSHQSTTLHTRVRGALRTVARLLTWPVRRLLEPRFADTNRRLQYLQSTTLEALGQATRQLDIYSDLHREQALLALGQSRRTAERVGALENELALFRGELADTKRLLSNQFYVERLDHLARSNISELDGAAANLLNYASGYKGMAAAEGLWINDPITLQYSEGHVEWAGTNERIAEIPFCMMALAELRPGSKVLDIGSAESLLPLSLASLGFHVEVCEPRGYRFGHPLINVLKVDALDYVSHDQTLDAVILISTLEHVGLGFYGDEVRENGDLALIAHITPMVRPNGLLIVTVPFGQRKVNEKERTYSSDDLRLLLEGWKVEEQQVIARADDLTWSISTGLEEAELSKVNRSTNQRADAVALIKARKITPSPTVTH